MMKAVLKASVFCWGIIGAFALFFELPFELLSPLAAGVLSVSVGGGSLAWLGFYLYRLNKKEGFEFGWFLGRKNGFWLLFLGAVGLSLFLAGGLWFVAPRLTARALEEGAMPFAALLVVLFWFSLISACLGFALISYAESVGYLRIKDFKWAAGAFASGTFWLALATLFCSLFLDVIDENFLRLSATTRNVILGLFALAGIVAGLCAGSFKALEKLLPEEDLERHAQKLAARRGLV